MEPRVARQVRSQRLVLIPPPLPEVRGQWVRWSGSLHVGYEVRVLRGRGGAVDPIAATRRVWELDPDLVHLGDPRFLPYIARVACRIVYSPVGRNLAPEERGFIASLWRRRQLVAIVPWTTDPDRSAGSPPPPES